MFYIQVYTTASGQIRQFEIDTSIHGISGIGSFDQGPADACVAADMACFDFRRFPKRMRMLGGDGSVKARV